MTTQKKHNATSLILAHMLEESGLSQTELASRIGVRRQAVQLVLSGRQYPGASLLRNMLAVLSPGDRAEDVVLQWWHGLPPRKKRRRS